MPDKSTWCGRLEEISADLRALPWSWIDRQTVEDALKVGRRRAQQILQPCVIRQIGANGVADREEFINHLQRLVSGETAYYERRRRERLASILASPKVLVEAPVEVMGTEIANLPSGVTIRPGEITVSFSQPVDALEKLLALAMAIGNDPDTFHRIAGTAS